MEATKKCGKCGESKPIESFSRRKLVSGTLIRQGWGKACYKKNDGAYYKANAKRRQDIARRRAAKVREFEKFMEGKKNVPCVDCGGRFPGVCMDFDHVSGLKKSGISGMRLRLMHVIEEEIKKV